MARRPRSPRRAASKRRRGRPRCCAIRWRDSSVREPKPRRPSPARSPWTPTADVGADAMAVSELSHATEEAGVFLAFGQTERAIDVLREHIRQLPRSMPAAWLMLLDLYHAEGNRPDFRKLAEDFHVHFNVQTPLWEAFAAADRRDRRDRELSPCAEAGRGALAQAGMPRLPRAPAVRQSRGPAQRLPAGDLRRHPAPAASAGRARGRRHRHGPQGKRQARRHAEARRAAASAATAPSRARRPMPPDPAASRPTQQPIRFDLDPPSSQGKPKS